VSNINTLQTKITSLGLSAKTVLGLQLTGIDYLADILTFSISDIKRTLETTEHGFDEIKPVLVQYAIPEKLTHLDLTDDTIEALNGAGIQNFRNLLDYDRVALFHLVKDDPFILQSINELFIILNLAPLNVKDETPPLTDLEYAQKVISNRTEASYENSKKNIGYKNYSHLKVRIASPDEIRMWSYGEVKTGETINYRSSKPESNGLFCEKIFGPMRDYQCACGSKKQDGIKGQICTRCGIMITEAKVRRERMGHIELKAPAVHTWYLKNSPSKLSLLLDIKAKELEQIVYYSKYIITEAPKEGLKDRDYPTKLIKKGHIVTETDYNRNLEMHGSKIVGRTGAEAVKKLLMDLDLEHEIKRERRLLLKAKKQSRDKILKRLEILEIFSNSDNKPEWMIMDVIPVIPPDLRPMVPLDGGRFATTDLNDLYRRIINRNISLAKQIDQGAPNLIIKNQKRMLQEAVDSLIDNIKRGSKAVMERNRPLKSLSDMLRGKQGRFRQNLLGKRVDFSGRSVIIVGPDLQMYQCGIPREMAYTLFKPFILNELSKSYPTEHRNIANIYERKTSEAWQALEKVAREHPVLLNRAPTLHRLGIQAFEPKLIEGKAIRLHPLVTPAFNADFDGDQMAVHVPLSNEAQAEARLLMLGSNNILNPKDGKPVVTPSQDMVLGNYYLTIEESINHINTSNKDEILNKNQNEGLFFNDFREANLAYEVGDIGLHTRIILNPNTIDNQFTEEQKSKYLVTTLGKLIFNQILPESFPYLNEPSAYNLEVKTPDIYFINKGVNPKDVLKDIEVPSPFKNKFLSLIIARVFKQFHISETSRMLDKLKDLGFKYSTVSGITISYSDIESYPDKEVLISQAKAEVDKITNAYDDGLYTDNERHKAVVAVWTKLNDTMRKNVMDIFETNNNIFIMSDSGARGKASNFLQLCGMRGLMNNPTGGIIEVPILANFKEGLTVSEFFISTHGARKGSTDTALKTAESGYLTRRLVDVAQDVIVSSYDCQTTKGVMMSELLDESDKAILSLSERIIGRFASKDLINPATGELLLAKNELISEEKADYLTRTGISSVEIRSVLTCDSDYGVCTKCYGLNLATNKRIEVGEAVGVLAAQSIGEPGTQLTMRTFHTGGVATADDITQGLPRIQELFELRRPKAKAIISEVNGKVTEYVTHDKNNRNPYIVITSDNGRQYKYELDQSTEPLVKKKDLVVAGQKLTKGSIYPKELLRIIGYEEAAKYIIKEVQKVYLAQNVEISDKHVEIITRQMFKRINIINEGDTVLLPNTDVSIYDFKKANLEVIKNGGKPAIGKQMVLGITKASLRSNSFLSAASFQQTTMILTDAAIRGKVDELQGLKENVIIGGLIPAGTGILRATDFEYDKSNTYVDPEYLNREEKK